MTELEHPDVTEANKTGYANLVAQPEHFGTDYFGNKFLKVIQLSLILATVK
ncbi:hypothetical protein [Peribacillus frigoritolerans]|uniref:hypothetical protein n=1 Tax=Peribacillus frigoritolerans TaxID=450367 RepID=UPI0023D9D617|nr:hypothetical protein [Peribacillus frigoritolerans]MDF1997622.1 hypothetical protein [Peribacillus frigoritolerans]